MKKRSAFRPMVILPLEAFAGSFDSAPKGVHTSDYYLSRIKKEQLASPSETKTNGWIPYKLR